MDKKNRSCLKVSVTTLIVFHVFGKGFQIISFGWLTSFLIWYIFTVVLSLKLKKYLPCETAAGRSK